MNYLSCADAAKAMGITVRRIQQMCKSGEIPGVFKEGRSWLIPENSVLLEEGEKKKPLPIGVSDFKVATTNYYYVDKTLLIRDFLDTKPLVSLFTRPRRFGKTLNMDMFRAFFEKTQENTSIYFRDKKIWQCGNNYTRHQGQYPVIFLTFKDVKCRTWEDTFQKIGRLISLEFIRHRELETSLVLSSYEKEQYHRLASENANEVDYQMGLQLLSMLLHKHYSKECIIIIDEYDTPIQQGYMKGYYEEITLFMRNLFSGGFKDNKHLAFGFLTGILRVAKESIFSGMNNLSINSVLDHKYSAYFGFTSDEVREMAAYYGASDKYDEICEWYDGYRFGKTEIFNPWSVVNYFSNECEPRAFWVSTGSNDVIGEVLAEADEEIYHRLASLVNGETITTYIDTGVIYPQIKKNPSTIYSFLLVTGYLKAVKTTLSFNGDFMCEVALPNREIALVYHKEILQKFETMIPQSTAIAVQEAIFSGDNRKLKTQIQTLLMESASSFDTAGENFYHGFMLGLCALLGGFFVTSNRESGEGRYDIQLKPVKKGLPGIIIELKAEKNGTEESLKQLSETALKQIQEKQYDTELRAAGVEVIYKYGVAFCGKRVEVAVG